jgi:DNA-binding XRE family transcriptional regulator
MTAQELIDWRNGLQLNQTQAAKALRVSVKAFRNWEADRNRIPPYVELLTAAVAGTLQVDRAAYAEGFNDCLDRVLNGVASIPRA